MLHAQYTDGDHDTHVRAEKVANIIKKSFLWQISPLKTSEQMPPPPPNYFPPPGNYFLPPIRFATPALQNVFSVYV